jgi:hypothetical protein
MFLMPGSCRQKIGAKRTIWRQLPGIKKGLFDWLPSSPVDCQV